METRRTKYVIPDAINKSVGKNYTLIPNELLRNPEITSKAKTILSILLSNKDGWTSYLPAIQSSMKEGETAILNGIKELQDRGYLMKIRYRDKTTKHIKGSFWAYTDQAFSFGDMHQTIDILEEQGLEPMLDNSFTEPVFHIGGNHVHGNPRDGNPRDGNRGTNNTNIIIPNLFSVPEKRGRGGRAKEISKKQFPFFWELYPNKKGSKGEAMTSWNKLCAKKERPTWEVIRKAIIEQSKSDQWQDKKFIPRATTWLNQSRWLDDPKEMITFSKNNTPDKKTGHKGNNPLNYKEAIKV